MDHNVCVVRSTGHTGYGVDEDKWQSAPGSRCGSADGEYSGGMGYDSDRSLLFAGSAADGAGGADKGDRCRGYLADVYGGAVNWRYELPDGAAVCGIALSSGNVCIPKEKDCLCALDAWGCLYSMAACGNRRALMEISRYRSDQDERRQRDEKELFLRGQLFS